MIITSAGVENLLRSEDIEGLISSGAPADEYDSEAQNISDALSVLPQHECTQNNILAIIAAIWQKSFGLSAQDLEKRMPELREVVEQLTKIEPINGKGDVPAE